MPLKSKPAGKLISFEGSEGSGKSTQIARLAARLSGWRVDIKSETQLAEEAEGGGVVADVAEGGEAIVGRGREGMLGRQAIVDRDHLATALVGEPAAGDLDRLSQIGRAHV